MNPGAAVSAVGQVIDGVAAWNMGKYNARIAERNAVGAERDASAEEMLVRQQVRQAMGAQLVAQGDSGFVTGTGSAFDALTESQVNGMVDALNVRRAGAATAIAYRQQGSLARMEGHSAMIRGMYGAAATLSQKPNYAREPR